MCQLLDGECRDRAALEIRGCQRGQGQGPTPAPSTEEAGGGRGHGVWAVAVGEAGEGRRLPGAGREALGEVGAKQGEQQPPSCPQAAELRGQGQGRDRLCPCGFKSYIMG